VAPAVPVPPTHPHRSVRKESRGPWGRGGSGLWEIVLQLCSLGMAPPFSGPGQSSAWARTARPRGDHDHRLSTVEPRRTNDWLAGLGSTTTQVSREPCRE